MDVVGANHHEAETSLVRNGWVERDPARGEVRGTPFGHAPGDEFVVGRNCSQTSEERSSTVVPTSEQPDHCNVLHLSDSEVTKKARRETFLAWKLRRSGLKSVRPS